jgi:hypothetical protein
MLLWLWRRLQHDLLPTGDNLLRRILLQRRRGLLHHTCWQGMLPEKHNRMRPRWRALVLRIRRDLLQPEHRIWLLLPRRIDLLLLDQRLADWSLLPAGRGLLR